MLIISHKYQKYHKHRALLALERYQTAQRTKRKRLKLLRMEANNHWMSLKVKLLTWLDLNLDPSNFKNCWQRLPLILLILLLKRVYTTSINLWQISMEITSAKNWCKVQAQPKDWRFWTSWNLTSLKYLVTRKEHTPCNAW